MLRRFALLALVTAGILAAQGCGRSTIGAEDAGDKGKNVNDTEKPSDKAADKDAKKPKLATVVIAGGCFWCVEAVFEELEGVIAAESGYAGGTKETANYKDVCTGATAHAEAVRITYDPAKISFERLLAVHFATHDPTTLNRQGHDVGPQYRSAIFYANAEEKKQALETIDRLTEAKAFKRPIVTTLEPLKEFFPAEMYHQDYVCINPLNPYVMGVAAPKVDKVRDKFKDYLKKGAQAVELRGVLKSHPSKGTKKEMIDGRYHVYVGEKAHEIIATQIVSEEQFDKAQGKKVILKTVKREVPADTKTDGSEQKPVGGIPAKTVFDVVELQIAE